MSKDILGVEISVNRISMIQVSNGKIVKYAVSALPDDCVRDGAIVAWEAMAQVISDAYKGQGFTTKKVAVVIPDSVCYVRRMVMPAMSEKQLLVNLPYEFKDVIQDDKEKYTFDYSMIGMRYSAEDPNTPKEMELVGAALSDDLIEKYTTLFNKAGLKLVKATPRIIALQGLIEKIEMDESKTDLAILDLGYAETKVDIFRNGIYEATRSIDLGIKDVTSVIANKLNCDPHIAKNYLDVNHDNIVSSPECVDVYGNIAIEIMRAINYYTYENQDSSLEELYFAGYGSWIEPFIQEISNNVSLPMIPISEVVETGKEALLHSTAAAGICMD